MMICKQHTCLQSNNQADKTLARLLKNDLSTDVVSCRILTLVFMTLFCHYVLHNDRKCKHESDIIASIHANIYSR